MRERERERERVQIYDLTGMECISLSLCRSTAWCCNTSLKVPFFSVIDEQEFRGLSFISELSPSTSWPCTLNG